MYDATFKIIIFGEPNTGKVTLTQRFLTNLFVSDQTMTIGVDFEVKSLSVDGQKVKLQIWDFGGEERFRFLLPTYVRGARGGLFLYDITNYSSIAHIDDWLSVIRKEIRAEDIFPIIVVGNRAHLVNDREVSSADGIRIAKSRGVNGFIEVSAKTGENVENAFEALTRLMLDDHKLRKRQKRTLSEILLGRERIEKRESKAEILLKTLLDTIPEIKSAVIASSEGFSFAHMLPQGVDETRVATMTAALLFLAERIVIENKMGFFDQIWIRGTEGFLIVMQITPDIGMIAFTTHSDILLKGKLKIKISSIVDYFLRKLFRAIPEIKPVTIASTERTPFTTTLPKGDIEERVATMTAALLSLSNRVINEMITGELQVLYVKGSESTLKISNDSPPTIKRENAEHPRRNITKKLRDLLEKRRKTKDEK